MLNTDNNNNSNANLPLTVENKQFLFINNLKCKFQNNVLFVLHNDKYMYMLSSQDEVNNIINNFHPNNIQYILDQLFFGDMIKLDKFYGNPFLVSDLNITANNLFIEGKLLVENKSRINNEIVFIKSPNENDSLKQIESLIKYFGNFINKKFESNFNINLEDKLNEYYIFN